jgi:hypothetical protein
VFAPEVYASMVDELSKISAAISRFKHGKTRSGRRPMSVTTLLRKEKDGSLYKKLGGAKKSPSDVPTVDEPGARQTERRNDMRTTQIASEFQPFTVTL